MFPKQFLSATHVVVADPVQFHLRPEDQRVVSILGEDILSGKGIGASFERLPFAFSLDNNARVYIYKKVKPLKEADLLELEKRFLGYCSEHSDIFLIDRK